LAHTAALYNVRVKERGGDHQRLGAFDDQATNLLDVLDAYLADFTQEDALRERMVRCLEVATDDDDLTATMQFGQSGLVADIIDEGGNRVHHQIASQTSLVRCGCLFRLPPAQTMGWLALHNNNRRGIKGLLATGLSTRFRDQFADHTLEITPYVQQDALIEAIQDDRVTKVKLIRYEPPNDRANEATDKWVQAGSFGKLELDISMRGRREMLKGDLLKRFYAEPQSADAKAAIVQFEGLEFEEAKVEVDLGGRTRTFNIEHPESGHPMTVDLDELELDADGDPTPESVRAGLLDALGSV
jgi:hypothetical protein